MRTILPGSVVARCLLSVAGCGGRAVKAIHDDAMAACLVARALALLDGGASSVGGVVVVRTFAGVPPYPVAATVGVHDGAARLLASATAFAGRPLVYVPRGMELAWRVLRGYGVDVEQDAAPAGSGDGAARGAAPTRHIQAGLSRAP